MAEDNVVAADTAVMETSADITAEANVVLSDGREDAVASREKTAVKVSDTHFESVTTINRADHTEWRVLETEVLLIKSCADRIDFGGKIDLPNLLLGSAITLSVEESFSLAAQADGASLAPACICFILYVILQKLLKRPNLKCKELSVPDRGANEERLRMIRETLRHIIER